MNILYVEPFSGLSGDMMLGALCSLIEDYSRIQKLPEDLDLNDARIEIEEVKKNGIVCRHIKVVDLNSEPKSAKKDHKDHNDHTANRPLKDIKRIIDASTISESAKKIAQDIFMIIGKSESRIHNIPVEKVHFHELSGVDSILDIVGCAVLLDKLEIAKTYSDPVCTGFGMVKTQHGLLPVPAPATADILQGIPCYKGEEEGERVTPTGAAILKYLEPEFSLPPMTTKKIAYGPGQKDFIGPNVVRLSLVETTKKDDSTEIWVIESNLDDSTAEYLGTDFQNQLLENGATDFYFTPVQMKKGRPGLKLTVLASSGSLDRVKEFVLENTSTIGLRYYQVEKDRLPRKNVEIVTKYGPVQVKEVVRPSGSKSHKIEYQSLIEISKKNNINILELETELYNLISHSS